MTKQKKFITCDGNQAAAHISYMFSEVAYRLIEAVLVALAIAGGYALAFLVMGGATV